jgi:hypothetical protein
VVTQSGRPGHLVEDADALQRDWFEGLTVVGLTSGASVPEMLVDGVIGRLRSWWPDADVQAFGEPERVVFNLPRALQRAGRPVAGRASTLVPDAVKPSLPDVPVALPASARARPAARPRLDGGRK